MKDEFESDTIKNHNASFKVDGLSCASCVSRVEKKALSIPGVNKASVNLLTETAEITFDENRVSASEIAAEISNYGYKTTPTIEGSGRDFETSDKISLELSTQPIKPFDKLAQTKKEFLISGALTLPLVVQMIFPALGLNGTVQVLISAWVQFVIGKRFYISAFKSIKNLSPNMDVLVAIGTTAAWGLSLYFLFSNHALNPNSESGTSDQHFYFETSCVVITFMIFGKWLEQKARKKTGESLDALQSLVPDTVTIVLENNKTKSEALGKVLPHTLFLVKNGERVPLDGIVTEGFSYVNESLVTGESLPLQKAPGDRIRAGSLLLEGSLTAQSTSDAAGSTIGRIISLVERAQASKAPIQTLVDSVCAIFVPAVLVIAFCTFSVWWIAFDELKSALLNAVAVLVIACPCALGLATPSAIVVGIGEAAKKGILIRDASSLEIAHKITFFLLDKTGTLTKGKPVVTSLMVEKPEHEFVLYNLSRLNSHPLCAALHAYLDAKSEKSDPMAALQDLKIVSLAGKGVLLRGDLDHYFFGNLRTLVQGGFSLDKLKESRFALFADEAATRGSTLSFLVYSTDEIQKSSNELKLDFKNAHLLGFVGFEDQIKPESSALIKELKHRKIENMLITGDNKSAATLVAQKVGIDWLQSEVLPGGKLNAVLELKKKNHVVAMVGDGVNDAPALSAADLSIAFASGSDVAVFSAGITLINENPMLILEALDIAKMTYGRIQQNLFWAFGFNVLAIPLAAAGMLNPALAGAAMALSSFFVVSNSLRLKKALRKL